MSDFVTTKIPLGGENGRGLFALIDADDMALIEEYRWYVFKTKTKTYAQGQRRLSVGVWETKLMHRLLCPGASQVDHKNGDGLDNRRSSNLRISGRLGNAKNRLLSSNSTCGFKGVTSHKMKWQAQIRSNAVSYYLGRFETAEIAARAYDAAARVHHGEYATLNFPNVGERGLNGEIKR